MNPLKRKDISKLTAESTGHDVALVDELVSYYYTSVQKKMAALEHVNINVPNLGTFTLKKKRVENKLEKYSCFSEKIDETLSMRDYETKLKVKHDISLYQSALDLMQQEELRKKEVNQRKEEHRNNAE